MREIGFLWSFLISFNSYSQTGRICSISQEYRPKVEYSEAEERFSNSEEAYEYVRKLLTPMGLPANSSFVNVGIPYVRIMP